MATTAAIKKEAILDFVIILTYPTVKFTKPLDNWSIIIILVFLVFTPDNNQFANAGKTVIEGDSLIS